MLELRQVTVLVCDLIGSTELTVRLARRQRYEDVKTVFDEFHRLVEREAVRHGAQWPRRYEGDGALVIFGYPVVLEDAPSSGIRCGLALARAIRATRPAEDVTLDARIGVAYGTVVLDTESGQQGWDDRGVVGTVPALATRLASVAPAGGLAIDHVMWRLVGRSFRCAEQGALSLKGFDEPVRVWHVLDALAVPEAVPDGDVLVGRDDELARLAHEWRLARAGHGRTVALHGDPGLGKTRLSRAAVDLARQEGARSLHMACTGRTRNTPLYPLSVALRDLAGIGPDDTAEKVAERLCRVFRPYLAPQGLDNAIRDLSSLVSGSDVAATPGAESPELIRARTRELMLGLLVSMAAAGPVVILLEDLHWSDPSTAELLRDLTRVIASSPVLVLVTARPDELQAGVHDLPGVEPFRLQPLAPAAARALVLQRAEGEALPSAAVERIVQRGEGCPLFLEEFTRTAMEAAALPSATGIEIDAVIPAKVHNIVQARLDRWTTLDTATSASAALRREVTHAAAVLGREFSLPMLVDLLGRPAADVQHMVARLIDDGILLAPESGARDRLRFKHALIHAAACRTLPGSDQRKLHGRVADMLRSLPAGLPDAAPDIVAFHWTAAERFVDAAACLIDAGAAALAKAAYREAEAHCRNGLAGLGKVRPPGGGCALERQLWLHLAVALTALHGYAAEEVEQAYRCALALCDDATPPAIRYPIVRGLATWYLVRGDLGQAQGEAVLGMQLADDSRLPAWRIDAMCVLSYTLFYNGQLAESRRTIEACLSLYEAEHGDRLTYPVPQDAATGALALLPTVAWLLGDAAAAEAGIARGIEHVEVRLGKRPFDAALLNAWVAGTRYTQRRFAAAAFHAQRAAQLSHESGYGEWLGTALLMLHLAQAAQEPSPASLGEAQELLRRFAERGVGLNASYYLWALARGVLAAGDTALAAQVLKQAFAAGEAKRDRRMNAELSILQAEIDTDRERARRTLADAVVAAEADGAVATALRAALLLLRYGGKLDEDDRDALDALDGRVPVPAEPLWMARRLEAARHKLQASARATS